MKNALLISALTLALIACGGGAKSTVKSVNTRPSESGLDDAKMLCVADGGFLVPSGNDFRCRLPSGNTVGLLSTYGR